MQTECTSKSLDFNPLGDRRVTAHFDGGAITTDGGATLLREIEQTYGIIDRAAECFTDWRNQDRIEYSLEQLLRQRVFGLILGYEDLNDHDVIRYDPALATASGVSEPMEPDDDEAPLAGKSTLNRLELGACQGDKNNRYKRIECDFEALDEVLTDLWLDHFNDAPDTIVIDADATDVELHGDQQDKFFHGYYEEYCYLPLYLFAGGWLVGSRLRRADQDGSKHLLDYLEPVVEAIRAQYPETRIILRGDSDFARDRIMTWCEQNGVDYVLGLAQNNRLKERIADAMDEARAEFETTKEPTRVFDEFQYETLDSWSCKRRVIGKAEMQKLGRNRRFVVTSLSGDEYEPALLYTDLYCARGIAENYIFEQQELFADRLSTHWMASNQLRVFLSGLAYVFICLLRDAAECVGWDGVRPSTLRLRLLKIGALVEVTTRRIWLKMNSSHPWQNQFRAVFHRIRDG